MQAKRIKVIYIENSTTQDEDPTRDDILDIIKEDQPIVVQPVEPVVMKKRASRAKVVPTPDIEPEVEHEVEPVVVEPVVEVDSEDVVKPEDEPKNIKTIELVVCPKCNKKLTSRTLKYSHESVCPENGNPPTSINRPKKQKISKEESVEPDIYIKPPLTAYEKRLNTIKEKQDKIKNLALHVF